MDFKQWFNEISVVGSATRPQHTAKLWWGKAPEKKYINQAFVVQLAHAVANPDLNNAALAAKYARIRKTYRITDEPILQRLIPVPQNEIKQKTENIGVYVKTFTHSVLQFSIKQIGMDKIGSIQIELLPMLYKVGDMVNVASCISHECQHAQDWIFGTLKGYKKEDMTMDEYLEEEDEVRAFTQEVFTMIEILQSEHNMSWQNITRSILRIIARNNAPYVYDVVKEFMRIVQRPTTNEAVMTRAPTQNKEQILQNIANLWVQELKKHEAGPFFTALAKKQNNG